MSRVALVPPFVLLALACVDNVTLPEERDSPQPISLTGISPEIGSTLGDTPVRITGTGFQSTLVRFGNLTVQGRSDWRDPVGTVIYLETRPHAAGVVEVAVADAGGKETTLAGGYTYALPESFDFNGNWGGFGNAGQDIALGFTIQNNTLVSVRCDAEDLTLPTPLSVTNGEFTYSKDGVVLVSGRIVSATDAVGTMNFALCSATNWVAAKF